MMRSASKIKQMEQHNAYTKAWQRRNKDKVNRKNRIWCAKNQERVRASKQKWERANRSKIAAKRRQRYYSDLCYRLRIILKSRIQSGLKRAGVGALKQARTKEMVGCDLLFLKFWLESKFPPGMTWANRGKWHVDHVIPVSSFDLTDPVQQRQCYHYTNLQPLWAKDNHAKGAKVLK